MVSIAEFYPIQTISFNTNKFLADTRLPCAMNFDAMDRVDSPGLQTT
jgi:hypothetical protein